MIIEAFLTAVTTVLKAIFGILPSLPPIAPVISDAAEWIITTLAGATFLFYYILGAFFYPVLLMTVALLSFEHIYHFVMWVIKKLPIGVK